MQSQPRGPTRPLGYHPIPIWNSFIGQPSDSQRADPFSEQLAQSMKRLSATMIRTSRILPLLCAPNGWLLIDTRDTCAVCESHLGGKKESRRIVRLRAHNYYFFQQLTRR